MEALQGFLRENKVDFETEPAPEQVEAAEEKDKEEEARGEAGKKKAAGEKGVCLVCCTVLILCVSL